MSMGKAAGWMLESLRSVVFLMLGLMFLGAAERPLTEGGQLQPGQMLLLATADLAILYVVHRNFLAQRRFYRASQKSELSAAKTVTLLGYACIAILITAMG
ncbi:hypothetical protein MUG84_09085 [Paenibacillus sp. KQZ6P-2]|uniref:Uncharacterized protein n=1 Tax=Paenibacillus mangrovi TaxID=2931978 RepID=A0A9X2B1U4_9BACL|nr:hypothetical protein [Paenibacillus mangrovi]MCJ8011894.1 hypothetical protein [Paenibacillus mangrovi]